MNELIVTFRKYANEAETVRLQCKENNYSFLEQYRMGERDTWTRAADLLEKELHKQNSAPQPFYYFPQQ